MMDMLQIFFKYVIIYLLHKFPLMNVTSIPEIFIVLHGSLQRLMLGFGQQ